MQPGWIKLHRKLMESSVWLKSTPEQKVVLIALLLMANHSASGWEWKGKPYSCEAGQFITSVRSIEKNCGLGVSRQNIRTALKRFKNLEFLTIESTNTNSLITICNWGTYQAEINGANQPSNHCLTNAQPTPNQRLTTNKNDKNVKNEKKNKKKYIDFVFLTDEEYKKLVENLGEKQTKEKIEALNNYIGSKGRKYKSHYHTILSWARKDKKEQGKGTVKSGKVKLYPIKGKSCSVRGCGMPAVYKDTSGDYDYYKCTEHLPEKVKVSYC